MSQAAKVMGVLKTVLPVLGTLQVLLACLYANAGFQEQQLEVLFGEGSTESKSASSQLLMRLLCPLFLGMGTMNIFTWTMGSTIRPKVAVANILTYLGLIMAHYRSSEDFPFKAAPVLMGLVGTLAVGAGLVLHQMEPGLLTDSKAAIDAKKQF